MNLGYLKIEARTLNNIFPVKDATVTIKSDSGEIISKQKTDESGNTMLIELEAPEKRRTLSPNYSGPYYSNYDVEVSYPEKYITEIIKNVQIFDTITSILPVTMVPKPKGSENMVNIKEISGDILHSLEDRVRGEKSVEEVMAEVYIPEYIVVHLGAPETNTKNVRVSFSEYIKNVASSEIYPTWPQAAIEANIYTIISFTLNRIYSNWYRNMGYDFDITSSTALDQSFMYGRNIFSNINKIIDNIFNMYIRKSGSREPLFAQYCNGTTTACEGLSKWGAVTLANQRLNFLDILKTYYQNDIEIVITDNISGVKDNYPGKALNEGEKGEEISIIQECLNKIRIYYPSIQEIEKRNGEFERDTKKAIKTFQKIFDLQENCMIDKASWYKIVRLYRELMKFEEVFSQIERIEEKDLNTIFSTGIEGDGVLKLQIILNYISEFYDNIMPVIQNGVFDDITKISVIQFQRLFGLTSDGIVGINTWRILYNVYIGIIENLNG